MLDMIRGLDDIPLAIFGEPGGMPGVFFAAPADWEKEGNFFSGYYDQYGIFDGDGVFWTFPSLKFELGAIRSFKPSPRPAFRSLAGLRKEREA